MYEGEIAAHERLWPDAIKTVMTHNNILVVQLPMDADTLRKQYGVERTKPADARELAFWEACLPYYEREGHILAYVTSPYVSIQARPGGLGAHLQLQQLHGATISFGPRA